MRKIYKTEKAHWYITLNIGDDNIYYHLLVQRKGTNVSPVKYIEGNNIEYF